MCGVWCQAGKLIPGKFKAALRVDPILSGNWDAVKGALVEGGYEESIEGAKQFLRDWATTMKPIYLMVCMPLHPAPPSHPTLR